jgi:ABC-type lipoprotein release transport system permease subunit
MLGLILTPDSAQIFSLTLHLKTRQEAEVSPLAAFVLTLAVSLLAGGIAAKRSISVDPANALHND